MPDKELWQQLFATKRDAEAQIERGHAERDRLAARVRELEAANKRLTYLLWHVLKNGRLEDDEMADARAALADSGPGGEEA